MAYYIYVLGTAGSGKSTLVSVFSEFIERHNRSCITVNLDPGAEVLLYEPTVDIRDSIKLSYVMEKYKLGPNGALIVAIDMIVNYLPQIRKFIEDEDVDFVLIDTPGQLELFAYREVGPTVISSLSSKNALILFLIDAFLSSKPTDLVSLLFLSSSVQARFLLPYLLVLSKIDLLSQEKLDRIFEWFEDFTKLEEIVEKEINVRRREIALNLLPLIQNLNFPTPIPVSSLKNIGLMELLGEIERIFGIEEELE